MPGHLSDASGGAEAAGLLAGVEDGVAFGWAAPAGGQLPFVVVRLDGVPVGAGACLAEAEPGDADARRHRFRIELDHGRLAHGGTVTAERAGAAAARIAGAVVVAPDAAPAAPADQPDHAFDKPPGLTVSGWIAVGGRAAAPSLGLAVNGGPPAAPLLPSRLAADAWRAGGSLASGYAITIPVGDGTPLPAEVRLSEIATGRLVWQGTVDAADCLIEDVRLLTTCGTDRHANAGPQVAARLLAAFRDHLAAGGDTASNAAALDLVGWLAGSGAPADALDLLLLLDPQRALQGRSAVFLETVAALLCDLPAAALPRLAGWLDIAPDAPARSRLLDYLAALAETRRSGLADGGTRLFRALAGMGLGQAAVNWAWQALAASPADAAARRTFRRTLEMQIAAQNVPFSAGFEFVAEDAR